MSMLCNVVTTTYQSVKPFHDIDSRKLIDRKTEVGRLQTFECWPHEMSTRPWDLARVGFFYTRKGDIVECCDCLMPRKDWKETEQPIVEHYILNKRCIYVQKFRTRLSSVRGDHVAKLPYGSVRERKRSFKGITDIRHSATELANAGFYYSNEDRGIKCFSCNINAQDMIPCDIPVCEHYKRSPTCSYLKPILEKLTEALRVTSITPNNGVDSDCSDDELNNGAQGATPKTKTTNELDSFHNVIDRSDRSEILNSTEVEAVVDMGYPKRLVEQVVLEHFFETKQDFSSAEDLYLAVMDTEFNASEIDEIYGTSFNESTDKTTSENDVCVSPEIEQQTSVKDEVENVSVSESVNDRGNIEQNVAVINNQEIDNNRSTHQTLDSNKQVSCIICLDNEVQITFQPCGHFGTCYSCSMKVHECPVCRTRIRDRIKTFLVL
ncbi:hypothetical protein SNE40_007380 [Patella caerulea]|uniref:RING-type domain-containing protein n=1 Tax=Patella caerulea TaxID=87958 RepID=A0AAN8K5T9_PATCE